MACDCDKGPERLYSRDLGTPVTVSSPATAATARAGEYFLIGTKLPANIPFAGRGQPPSEGNGTHGGGAIDAGVAKSLRLLGLVERRSVLLFGKRGCPASVVDVCDGQVRRHTDCDQTRGGDSG